MRKRGILVQSISFPSPFGIGDLGAESYKFIDFLVRWTLESENMIETYTELENNPYLPTNGSYLLMANIIKETIFDSGVKADMGVSEENESGTTDYDYYNYNGKYVREQREIWGDF